MNYYLDTDICVFALKGQFPAIKKWLQGFVPDHIKIPSVVKSELLLGALKSTRPKETFHLVERFLGPYEIISFDGQAAVAYARIRHELETMGKSIGPNDLIIAATVVANQGTLVTHNSKEFNRVPGLLTEDWTIEGYR